MQLGLSVYYPANHLSHVCACQFYRTDLMANICQLLLTHSLASDTAARPSDILVMPILKLTSLATFHIRMQASLLLMMKDSFFLFDPNSLLVFALQGVLLL